MASVYIFQADIYCEECGKAMQVGKPHSDDSGTYPQGPYPDGGGEADTPQHCGGCGEFLCNPLTGDGVEYVRDAVAQRRGRVWREWSDFYEIAG
jgi:hypothetical protein